MSYQDKLYNLTRRRAENSSNISFTENYDSYYSLSEQQKALHYTETAMLELPKRSTEISFEEGDRIKKHLIEELPEYNLSATFRYQGSVICNTHIKFHSDIDLLVIIKRFYNVENPYREGTTYKGNPTEDMITLRNACIKILKRNFDVAKITPNAKAITISGGSLKRNIDVVPANWYYPEIYYNTKKDFYKGVKIFNSKTNERNINFPFLTQHLIDEKDKNCFYKYRRLVRLAKTLKEDSDKHIDISSYDIQAIFYNMNRYDYICSTTTSDLISNATSFLEKLLTNTQYFKELKVPDNTRKISDKVELNELHDLYTEFVYLNEKIKNI